MSENCYIFMWSLWFDRILIGVKLRMGSIWKPNKGMSIELLLSVIERAEQKIMEKRTMKTQETKTLK